MDSEIGSLAVKGIEEFIRFVASVLKRMRINFDGRRVYISFAEEKTKGTIDERIANIDLAKKNLLEGLKAIDELKEEAERNKKEVAIAVEQVTRLEKDESHLQSELKAIKTVVETDVTAFQRVAGVLGPSEIRRERLLGFVSGVIASATASGIVALTVWGIKHFVLKS